MYCCGFSYGFGFNQNVSSDEKQKFEIRLLDVLVSQLAAFCSLFLLSNSANKVVVFACNENDVSVIYEDESLNGSIWESVSAGNSSHNLKEKQERLKNIFSLLKTNIASFLESISGETINQEGAAISAALSLALCYMNRRVSRESYEQRILCLNATVDQPAQYLSFVNSLFCAQRLNIAIDACNLCEEDSSFQQQAAHFTGGIYLKPRVLKEDFSSLLSYLCDIFISNTSTRPLLKLLPQETTDFRAICFQAGKKIDVGYVCSVCLSIFSEQVAECSTCGTSFQNRHNT
eukprot:jgi/Galph1/3882/GphlegSOOS_G2557.1